MAKKKTNSLFASIDSNTENNNTVSETSLSATVENVETETIETDDLVQNLKNEISKLNAENATLTEKLAAYIENNTTNAVDNTSVSAELEKLRYEKNELQNENDSYLMKISELSFENAKLASQLQQLQSLSKDNHELAAPVQCNNDSSQKVPTSKSNFVPYNRSSINGYNSNGYNSWN